MDHHHLIVQAWVRRSLTEPAEGIAWVTDLLRKLDMTLMLPPQAAYSDIPGNRGLTVVALITTSHISLHFWDEPTPAELQLDVYSCKSYRKEIVFEAIKERFMPVSIRYKFIDRQRSLILLDEAQFGT
jgi:S-adenosylmethionine/arginine decarboxylase-like enzyme